MENRITGRSPDPITDEVDLSDNLPAQELCEEVKQVTAQAREGLLMQALAVSNEKCNDLILTQNVRIAELTRQVKNVESSNRRFVNELRGDVWMLSKEVKESNNQLSKSLNQTLSKISETVTDIEHQVSTATAKATDEAVRVMKQSITKMADNAVIAVNESAGKMMSEVNKAKKEIEKAKDGIRFESGFRKFMFWLSPVLAIAQTIALAIVIFG